MPRLAVTCAECDKKITSKDFETKMIIHSSWTNKRWCPKCSYKLCRRPV